MIDYDRWIDFNFIYPACFHSHSAVQQSQLEPLISLFIFQWISIPTTNQVTFHVSHYQVTSLTKLTLGPVIKFNQVKESMNQSMTNSTQLNFKNQVKIKLQVKFELTLVIVKRLNMVKLLTVHCSASHERRVLTPNSRSYWFYLIRDHGSDWTSNTNHTEQVETSTGSSSTMPRVLLNCNYSVKLQNLFSSFTFTSLSKSTQAQLLIHSLTHSSTHSNLQTNLKPTS